jgi:hypothetical protein
MNKKIKDVTKHSWLAVWVDWNEQNTFEIRPQRIFVEGSHRASILDGWSSGYAPIAKVKGDKRLIDNEIRAKVANLVAAAPDLYVQLELLISDYNENIESAKNLLEKIKQQKYIDSY